MNRLAGICLLAAITSGCAIGVPAGRLLADGVKDFCSHSPPHKALMLDEVNEAVAQHGTITVTCVKAGSSH